MEEELDDLEPKKKSPLIYIGAVLLIFIMVLMIFPLSIIKLNPQPQNIPTILDVLPPDFNINFTKHDNDISALYTPSDPMIKAVADKIATRSCPNHKLCHAKAMFYFVRDNIHYVPDPGTEYYESPYETLFSASADCDGHAILLANLLSAVGIQTRFVFIPRHVYVEAFIERSHKFYGGDDWIPLDPTCSNCEFGELALSSTDKKENIVYP